MDKYVIRVKNEKGLTLIELMVALVLSSMVIAAIFLTFNSQHKSYVVQDRVSDMQQNVRAAMYYMEREIRMAGCDPTGDADAAITVATNNSLSFSLDIGGGSDGKPDGDTDDSNEQITYTLDDSDGDGVNDELNRNNFTIAQNIDALNFVYLKEDGNPILDASDDIATNIASGDLGDIRSIQVTIVARTEGRDAEFNNNSAYQLEVMSDGVKKTVPILSAQNDKVRRRMLSTRVRCRNLGL